MPLALKKVLALLTPGERRRGLLVLAMMVVLALFETAGIASVMPFLAVLENRDVVRTNDALQWLYARGGFESVDRFLFALGVAAFVLVVVSALLRIATTYAMHRFTQMRRYSIGERLLKAYLRQPYEFFLNRNSADLSKTILSEVDTLVVQVLRPGMEIIAYGLILVVLAALLVIVDPVLAVVAVVVVSGVYGAIYLGVRGLLGWIGGDRLRANRERFTAASEAFGGIKDLKVLGREQAYVDQFRDPAVRYARHQATFWTVSAAPKYLIEAVGFGGILALALTLMATRQDGQVLPLLGLYAFAGYRLLPAAQRIYAGISALRFGLPAVDAVYDDLTRRTEVRPPRAGADLRPLDLGEGIEFDDVSFTYPGAGQPAIRSLEFAVPARTTIGLVGSTGAGKTTAVDLILGLLKPTSGRIRVDGVPLTSELIPRWQRTIGYVPQSIYLADASVAANIAFGIEPEHIDLEAVERAARIASIHDFITGQLPDGYGTPVGERGVRLSGGQRQRIGIARALYHDPALLVLDEATSALDTATERAILESVHQLSGEKTIVMIAHRISTVENCDQIAVLQAGALVGLGTFEELKVSNEMFRKLAIA